MSTHRLDIIGDVHGELPALTELLAELGYTSSNGGVSHVDGRHLVFLGDLIDRGSHSLEVSEFVLKLVRRRQATCIMGNHEFNLVAHLGGLQGYERPKKSNTATVAQVAEDPERWLPVLEFLAGLPLAIDLPELRLAHACWHADSLRAVRPFLGVQAEADVEADATADTAAWVNAHVALTTPFALGGLKLGLEHKKHADHDPAHEILMKGFETAAREPFKDNDGKTRDLLRAAWWQGNVETETDPRIHVFGHYWNVPPHRSHFAPPQPSGHPSLREWQREMLPHVESFSTGTIDDVEAQHICVDFQGITQVSDVLACVGAFRWPERRIVWACGPRTRE